MNIYGTLNKDLVAHWINERWKIFSGRETGNHYLSEDYRMNQNRFCNVHRENDKVTRALRATWAKPTDNQDDLPMVCLLARRLNRVASFEYTPRPTVFTSDILYPVIKNATEKYGLGSLVNGQAYRQAIMSHYNDSPDGERTHAWAVSNLTDKTWRAWKELQLLRKDTLEETHADLMLLPGVGSFMAAQVVADLKHTEYLKDAPDWWTWAAIGPGSKRGLNWYFDGDQRGKTGVRNFLDRLHQMEDEVLPLLSSDIPKIGSQDWQNVMCEFDKYCRRYNEPNTGKMYRSR